MTMHGQVCPMTFDIMSAVVTSANEINPLTMPHMENSFHSKLGINFHGFHHEPSDGSCMHLTHFWLWSINFQNKLTSSQPSNLSMLPI